MTGMDLQSFERFMAFGGVFAVGVLMGAILATMYFRPNLLATMAQLKAIAFLGLGIGILVWGTISLSVGGPFEKPFSEVTLIRTPAEAIGWGAGFIAAGVVSLVISFTGLGRR
jgi:hypothetical protein